MKENHLTDTLHLYDIAKIPKDGYIDITGISTGKSKINSEDACRNNAAIDFSGTPEKLENGFAATGNGQASKFDFKSAGHGARLTGSFGAADFTS